MEPEDTYALFQRGRAHLERGDNAQATVSLEKAKRREPDKASIREALGVAYLRLHRYEEAAAEFEHILAAAPAPTRTRRPAETAATSSEATVTDACVTRWMRARTGRSFSPSSDRC